jgi:regulator of ribonuclease activity A
VSAYLDRFLAGEATADLVDALVAAGEPVRTCEVQFVDLGGRGRFAGPVRTTRCFEDNSLVRQVLSTPGSGAVLVVDGGGSLRTALVGDVIGGLAVDNGWSGLVVNGAVRDRLALAGIDLGVRALGTNPRKSAKQGRGDVDQPVAFGGVEFSTDDVVLCDADGILVVAS